jgi:hypothetical protein
VTTSTLVEAIASFNSDASGVLSPRVAPSISDSVQEDVIPLNRVRLSPDDFSKIEKTIQDFKVSAAAAPKDGDANTKVSFKKEKKLLLLPKSFYSDDDHLVGLTLLKLASQNGLIVELYESDKYSVKGEPTQELRRILQGFWIGCDDKVNIKLVQNKKETELGRAIAFAIRVRSYFRSKEKLGIASLRKDHKFFANAPSYDAKTKTQKGIPLINAYMRAYFTNVIEADEIAHLMCSLLEYTGLDKDTDPHQLDAIISSNVLPYSTILDPLRRRPLGEEKPKKTSDKRKEMGKLPDKPTSSPLLKKDEMVEYHSLTNFIWSALDQYSTDYLGALKNEGFSHIVRKTRFFITLRWSLLSSFSKVTTERLQLLKKEQDDPRLVKRRVTDGDLDVLTVRGKLNTLRWVKEIAALISPMLSAIRDDSRILNMPHDVESNLNAVLQRKDEVMFKYASIPAPLTNPPISVVNRFAGLEQTQATLSIEEVSGVKQKDLDLAVIADRKAPLDKLYFSRKAARSFLNKLIEYPDIEEEISSLIPDVISLLSGRSARKWGPNSVVGKLFNYLDDICPKEMRALNNEILESAFGFDGFILDLRGPLRLGGDSSKD